MTAPFPKISQDHFRHFGVFGERINDDAGVRGDKEVYYHRCLAN
jgi:hypothetical protein